MKKILISLFIILCSSIFANSQDLNSICQEHIKRLGELSKIENIEIRQTVYAGDSEIKRYIFAIPDSLYYQEDQYPHGKKIYIAYKNKAWSLDTEAGKSKIVKSDSVKNCSLLMKSLVFGPIYDYVVNNAKGMVSSLSLEHSHASIKGEKCYKLKAEYSCACIMDIFLSCEDYMIKRIILGNQVQDFGDYHLYKDIMFPEESTNSDNTGSSNCELEAINFNVRENLPLLKTYIP